MASSYTFYDALNLIGKGGYPSNYIDAYGITLLNTAQALIWHAADWRLAIKPLTPFYLSPRQQDYGYPVSAVPSDFLGLRTANLVNAEPDPFSIKPLNVVKFLDLTDRYDVPESITYDKATAKIRLYPNVPDTIAAPYFFITGKYKKTPSLVTQNGLSATLPWEDSYFHVFLEALDWAVLSKLKDPRAGQLQYDKRGHTVYTGQLGVAMAAIGNMADSEAINFGDAILSPAEPLVIPDFPF